MPRVVLRGRSAELGQILAAVRESARSRRGALVVLTGEPGIGKTALLRAAIEQAGRGGAATGLGAADEMDQMVSGAPLLHSLRSGARPVLGSAAYAELQALYHQTPWLVERIGVLLEEAARAAPVVLAVDDVHWADPLTRFALRMLPGRLAGSPVTWTLTSPLARAEAVDEIAAAAADGSVPVAAVRLGPLPAGALADLARDHLGAPPTPSVRELLGEVGGNPFWAVQVLEGLAWRRTHGLSEENPHADLIEHVRLRLAPLSPESQELVRLSAVWGRALPVDEAATLLDLPGAQIIAAARAAAGQGLLTIADDRVDQPHALVRNAVHADIPRRHRESLHRRCGRHLRESSPAGAAAHFLAVAATDDCESVTALLQAAAASARDVPDQAAELAQRALSLVSAGHPREAQVGRQVIGLLLRVQREKAVPAIADRLIAAAPDGESIAVVQVDAARALWAMGAYQQAEARITETMRLGGISELLRGRLLAVRALVGTRTRSSRGAAPAAESALTGGRRLGDELTCRLALMALAESSRNTGRHAVALEHLVTLRELSPDDHLAEEIRTLQSLDRYAEADTILRRIHHDKRDTDDKILPAYLCAWMWQDHNLGRLDAARTGARSLLRVAQQLGNSHHEVNARTVLAGVALYRGDLREAGAVLGAAGDRDESDDQRRATPLRLMDGWLAAEEGRAGDAVAVLAPLVAGADDGTQAWPWAPAWMHTFAAIGLAAGDAGFARAAVAIAQLAAERNPGVPTLAGVALQTRGLVEGDAGMLAQAVEVLRSAPRPLLLARALADYAKVLREQDETAADVRMREALGLLRSLGVSPGASAEPRLLAAHAAAGRRRSRRPATGTGQGGLTDAERRVAELIAEGHTTRSAAAELGISPNTLNTHLKSIFVKLGVRSRVQLINVLRG